jgi:hypothetical protein
MMAEDKKKPQDQEVTRQMSRREFAIGSVAMLGGYSMAEAATVPPLSPEAQAMKLEISDTVQSYLEVRHILEDDVKRVIDNAEKTGEKLYQPDSSFFLSKLHVKDVYFYVEYAPWEGGYKIYTAYSHRFLMEGDKP